MLKKPSRLALAALAACACFAYAAATASASPFVQGPEITPASTLLTNPFGPCLFLASNGLNCYVPDQIRAAYDYPSNLNGTGQTIVIVDAYQHQSVIGNNLATFDRLFGIPNPGTPGGGTFTIVNGMKVSPAGSGSGDVDGWGGEVALDVEWAHAMAPNANLVLVQTATDDDADIAAAENQWLPQFPGAIVSQSFGEPETMTGDANIAAYHTAYENAIAKGGTILASAGDWGATFTPITHTTSPYYASYPASDPLVTGVGGTQGLTHDGSDYGFGLLQNGHYGDEQVWNEPAFDIATGGAPSVLFAAPPWQRSASPFKTRAVPDVTYNAAVDGGVYTIHTFESGPNAGKTFIFLVAGTSSGSPQWAAIFSLVDQARAAAGEGPLGFANEALYKVGTQNKSAGAFHDITVGNDALDSPIGFAAGPGYDAASGLGAPDVSNLISALLAQPASSNPNAGGPAAVHPGGTAGQAKPHTQHAG
jgi:subtilase family serine protease